jgi:hypothetical protein
VLAGDAVETDHDTVDQLERLSEPRLQARAEPPSHPHLGTAAQHRDVVAVRVLPQFADEIDVDDRGAMAADESPRVERFLERSDQAAMRMRRTIP